MSDTNVRTRRVGSRGRRRTDSNNKKCHKTIAYRLPCDFFVFGLFEDPLRSIVIGIGDAYPCSASAKNTTVFTRSVTTAAAAAATADVSDAAVSTPGGKGHGGDGVNLPLSRLSRYSAACNKAAMLIFDGGRRLLVVLTHTAVTHKQTRAYHTRTH